MTKLEFPQIQTTKQRALTEKLSFQVFPIQLQSKLTAIKERQVNSDIHLQTVEIQMRRLLIIRIFTVRLVN